MAGTTWAHQIIENLKSAQTLAQEAKELAEQTAQLKINQISAMHYKGQVATEADLPTSGNEAGDTYNVADSGKNFAWDGEGWDDMSGMMTIPTATVSTIGGVKLGTSVAVSSDAGMLGLVSNGAAAVRFANKSSTQNLAGVVKLSSSSTSLSATNAAAIGRDSSYQLFVPVATTSANGAVKLATALTDTGAQSVPTASMVNTWLSAKADASELSSYATTTTTDALATRVSAVESGKLDKSGGTITGQLTVGGSLVVDSTDVGAKLTRLTTDIDGMAKSYGSIFEQFDSRISSLESGKLDTSGGTISGQLTIEGSLVVDGTNVGAKFSELDTRIDNRATVDGLSALEARVAALEAAASASE